MDPDYPAMIAELETLCGMFAVRCAQHASSIATAQKRIAELEAELREMKTKA